jgi:hypothetical protein
MTELMVIVLLLATWGLTSIVIRLIDRRCRHEYETIDEYPVIDTDPDNANQGIPVARLYVMRCKKCGQYKSYKLHN